MKLTINQNGIVEEDKALALSVRNHILQGNFVIGNPGLGLKKTLSKLEEEKNKPIAETAWEIKDGQLLADIAKTKAGIEGEEKLCAYLSRLLKYDDELKGLICFASLCYDEKGNTKDYIPDTDTLFVYGNNILVVDAKNIKTKSNVEYTIIEGGTIIDENEKVLLEGINPSTHIWKDIFNKKDISIDSIDGYVCIVNETKTNIFRNDYWHVCNTKLIHIAELLDILKDWIKGKDNTINLKLLTEISKAQIKEETNSTLDLSNMKRKFKI